MIFFQKVGVITTLAIPIELTTLLYLAADQASHKATTRQAYADYRRTTCPTVNHRALQAMRQTDHTQILPNCKRGSIR